MPIAYFGTWDQWEFATVPLVRALAELEQPKARKQQAASYKLDSYGIKDIIGYYENKNSI